MKLTSAATATATGAHARAVLVPERAMGPIERELWRFWEQCQRVDAEHGWTPEMTGSRVIFGNISIDAGVGVLIAAHDLSSDEPARPTSQLFWNDAYSEAVEAAERLGL